MQAVVNTVSLLGNSTQSAATAISGMTKQQQLATLVAAGYSKKQIQLTMAVSAQIVPLDALNTTELKNLATKAGLTTATGALTVANKAEALSTIQSAVKAGTLSAAQGNLLISTLGLTAAKNAETSSVWANIKAWAAWYASNPIGWIMGLIAVLGVAVTWLKKAAEEQQNLAESTKEASNSIASNKTEIQSLEEQLTGVRDRLRELNAIDSPTLADQDETTKLVKQNAELAQQITLLKAKNEELAKQQQEDSDKAWKLATTRDWFFGMPTGDAYAEDGHVLGVVERQVVGGLNMPVKTYTAEEYGIKAVEEYSAAKARLVEIERELVGLSREELDAYDFSEKEKLDARVSELRTIISSIASQFEGSTNQGAIAFFNKLTYAIADAESKSAIFKGTIADLSETQLNELSKLSDSGELTKEALSNIIGEDNTNKLIGLAGSVEQVSQEFASILEQVNQTTLSCSNLSSALSSLTSDTDDLQKAMDSLSSNPVEFDKLFAGEKGEEYLKNLLSKFPQLEDELKAYQSGLIT